MLKTSNMRLSILGKSRKGKKDFSLSSEKGYTITCVKNAYSLKNSMEINKFSGVVSIEWQLDGRHVMLSTFEKPLDFTKYDEVKIVEGTEFPETKEVTLGMGVGVDQSFFFGGVKFVKTSSMNDTDEDYSVICVIFGTNKAVAIMNTAVVEIEL